MKSHPVAENYLEVKDHAYSQELFFLQANQEGALLHTTPLPSNLDSYYSVDSYISHQKNFNSFSDKLYKWAHKFQLKRKERLLLKHLNGPKKILDFGAGSGNFVTFLKQRQWHVLGVEPNPNARAVALENNCVLHPSLVAIPKQQFQLITLWHVLEHVEDYKQTVEELLAVLAPGGHLVLALPNFTSWDAQHYKSFWAAYDVPRHLWHFSPKAICNLAEEKNLQLVKTYPMPLDAFYVSLVSERFKKNPIALPVGFLKGAFSNFHALRSGNYSSMIYVLQKAN